MTRAERVEQLLDNLLARRESGEIVSVELLLLENADLQPELGEAIEFAALMGTARGLAPPAAAHRMPVLSDDELNAPIDLSSSGDEDAVGSLLSPLIGGYEIIRMIGRGGQAVVFEGRQLSTRQRVAVKVLNGGQFATPRSRGRFEAEAFILASFHHPAIVGIIDRGTTADGSMYIVMPFADGPEIDDYFSTQRETLDVRSVARCFAAIATAIGVAHSQNIVHRDLKPSNIRVDSTGQPRVLDFGLARLLGIDNQYKNLARTMTAERTMVGSLPYASPEQVRGDRDLDGRADVYALGLMIFEVCAGAPAYPRDVPVADLIKNILQRDPGRASARRTHIKGVNRSIDLVLKRCLCKKPEGRYANAAELAGDLDRIATNQKIAAKRPYLRGALTIAAVTAAIVVLGLRLDKSAWPDNPTVMPRPLLVTLPTMTSSVGAKLVQIPTGQMYVGSPSYVADHGDRELQQLVTIERPFWIGTTEVTRRQYAKITAPRFAEQIEGAELPVTDVTLDEAKDFCRRLSEREHRHYRLPTEAEWEFACRARGQVTSPTTSRLNQIAWWAGNSTGRLHAVGGLAPNVWGLYDAIGNAAEWCEPKSPSVWPYRGGTFESGASFCRPESHCTTVTGTKSNTIGFRLAAD